MELFRKNIDAVEIHSPHIAQKIKETEAVSDCEVISSKKGLLSLKIKGCLYHSVYDPSYEAKSLVDKFLKENDAGTFSSLVIMGMGIGYHIEEFLKAGIENIVVIEKDCQTIKAIFEKCDISHILDKIKLFTFDSQNNDALIEELKSICGNNPLIYIYPPANKILRKEDYEAIVSGLTPFEYEDFRGLKVMVTYPLYGGSYPIAEFTSRAFEKIGCRVERFDMSEFYPLFKKIELSTDNSNNLIKLKGLFLSMIEEMFVARVVDTRPGMIFSLAQTPIGASVINRIKPLNIPLCYWFVEDFRLLDYWKNIASAYDYFFTIQKGDFYNELTRYGIKNYHYLPTACDPQIHKPLQISEEELAEFKSDISFMGAGYYNRRIFFKKLANYDFKIWGTEWPLEDHYYKKLVQREGKRISTEDTVKIYNASAVNINLHSSTYHSSVNPNGDFVNPRLFEIPACGGFQIADYRQPIDELFTKGEEIECFKDIGDLRNKINFYLDHPDERKTLIDNARKRVLRDHTYEKRMCEVLKIVATGKNVKLEKPSADINSFNNLMNHPSADEEFKKYISKFEGNDKVSIKDIAEEIRKADGDLTQTEKIFLMMSEFA